MDPNRVSPILIEMIWAPGATPFLSGWSGKYPAAIPATWEAWAPKKTIAIEMLVN